MSAVWRRAVYGPVRLVLAALALLVLFSATAYAEDRAQITTTAEDGFGRVIVDFSDRLDMPAYKLTSDNGVMALTFTDPVKLAMPDLPVTLPDFVTIGRTDPDGRGLRLGLRAAVTIHTIEAGEQLFIDFLPPSWQGLPPSLPPEVIADLSQRAINAAALAEQKRKQALAEANNPTATIKIGRNPTFMRVEFDWNVDADAKFAQDGTNTTLTFSWPVPIDLSDLATNLPKELTAATNTVTADGSDVLLTAAAGVMPRFYKSSERQYIVDIDLSQDQITANLGDAAARSKAAQDAEIAAKLAAAEAATELAADQAAQDQMDNPIQPGVPGQPITPMIDDVGGTVRVTFPFASDTASAVFRRGDTVWMLFDTPVPINAPGPNTALDSIATGFTVIPSGATQIVRMDLSKDRLATLASEGRSWVLSLGDVLLNATEPLVLQRVRDKDGRFEMKALLGKPYQVHAFRDPIVGDTLDVVTAFPPARGSDRNLDYVDFEALRSIHGLVVRPDSEGLDVRVDGDVAVISLADGLTLSDMDGPRTLDSGSAAEFRNSFVDLTAEVEDDPAKLVERREVLSQDAANADGQARDLARLKLAQFYVGNQFAEEAIGVVDIMLGDLKNDELAKKAKLTLAIADTVAARPHEALPILSAPAFDDEVDALLWRSMARTEAYDFVGGRSDALASAGVIDSYPIWVRQRFLLDAVRSAVETNDTTTAQKMLDLLAFAQLSPEQVTYYQLFQGRIAEEQGRGPEALDFYGQVIAADVRPTRAEAVYRTLLMLRDSGQIDLVKATQTLSAEAMLWRGNPLEADMQRLLAELYFSNGDYRLGFETVKQAVAYYPDSTQINVLLDEAQTQFADLYINGEADRLNDVDALSLYYDFRNLTPAGARGDEMIRNLARRLVKVDLLAPAGDLLQYQIDNRLKGAAQSQVAADLALIRIADRNPEAALRVLYKTRVEGLSPGLDRQRRILEARALIDADREDLALDLLSRVDGRDADLLRVDGYWKIKNYSAASDLIETVYSGDGTEPLSATSRMNILKAGVGLVLAGDKLGLSRIRSKFAEQMSQSAEWPLFDYITSPDAVTLSPEFKAAAKEVSGLDSLAAFLTAYKQIYAVDPALTPDAPSKPNAA